MLVCCEKQMNKTKREVKSTKRKQHDVRFVIVFIVILCIYVGAIVGGRAQTSTEPGCQQLDFGKSYLVSVQCDAIVDASPENNKSSDMPVFFFEPIPINHASFALLQTVRGVGPKLAQQIIQHREEFGLFTSVDSIRSLTRVGEKRSRYLATQFSFD